MSAPLQLRFVRSAPSVDDLPASTAEVAVIGRSNVGKSSLLNALAGQKDLARTSSTPGRTQLLQLFELSGHAATLVDCPGYGYAKVSKSQRASWERMIDRYLTEREPLVMALMLVDGEIGPTNLDLDVLDGLREFQVPHTVVATKHDKVKSSQRERRKRDLAARCQLPPGDVVWVSVTTKVGIDRLRDLVRGWLKPPGGPSGAGR